MKDYKPFHGKLPNGYIANYLQAALFPQAELLIKDSCYCVLGNI